MKKGELKRDKNLEILIVEDSRTQAESLKYMLEGNNYNVSHSLNGRLALVLMETFIPDLIISDILMPEMDGYELCRRIKMNEKLKHVPVILLTSLSDPEDVLKGLTNGADNFFTKPCQEDYLISHIDKIFEAPKNDKPETDRSKVEIFFNGESRVIIANQSQLLSLLLSTYEVAVMQNKQLINAQEELKKVNENLEEKIEIRTQELKESKEKYFDLYNNAPAMFLSVETNSGGIIECNDTLLVKTGFTRSELIGEHVKSIFYPSGQENAVKIAGIFSEASELKNIEIELLTKLGGKIPVLLNATPVKVNGNIIALNQIVMQDISLFMQAQEQIRQSEERFRAVADSAVDSIITIDEVGIIVGWNQGAVKTFGFAEKEIIGHQVSMIIPDFYHNGHSEGLKRVQQGGEPHVIGKTVELEALRKNGEVFPVELSLAQWLTSSDRFFTGIIRDITTRKIVQNELVAAKEKAEESDKLKTAFLANMSHEIRTPLNGILGFAQILKENNLSKEEKEDYLATVDQCSDQLLRTVTDIIDISKIEAGQDKANPVPFNLTELLKKIMTIFKTQADERTLEFSLVNELSGQNEMIISDPDKLMSALNNVINNAIKFTETGGLKLNVSKMNGNIIFKISDTGIGIDPVFHSVIFDRFRQVELSHSRKYGGTGLGLSLSKSYIEMLNGTIKVDSSVGNGSTFTITIPYVPGDVHSNEKKTGGELTGEWRGKTILVAEDEENNLFLVKAMLKYTGINILTAKNGKEAVDECKNNKEISLVLMDLKMPEMDGLTATRHIKSFRMELPVIATTAFAFSGDKVLCLEAGCDDFLSKPYRKEDLKNIIGKFIE